MGMQAGTPFALAHTFAQTGPFRPPNVERKVPGLVFAGSGTVPGVGVPMVLISGKLAADRVQEYLPSDRPAVKESACGDPKLRDPEAARRLPRVRPADLATRHDLLLGRAAAPS